MEREEVFVRRFQVRVQTRVRLSKALGCFATFEIQFEIYESENDDGDAVSFTSSVSDYAAQLATVVLPKLFALVVQTPLRCIQLIRPTSARPIDIIMPDYNQNQIGKPLRSQELIDLSGKIACPEDAAKKILSATVMIDHRTDSRIFDRNERRDLFQPFGNASNVRRRADSP